MNRTKKNYIPFIAGMATMVLLACLISASLAKEDKPEAKSAAAEPGLAVSEAGVALFSDQWLAPGEKVRAENGEELPAVLTYTDEKGEVHYYVEAETIGDILDVAVGVNYHEDINCVDFGAKLYLDENGETYQDLFTGKTTWVTGDVVCDIQYMLTTDKNGKKIATAFGSNYTSGGFTYTTNTGTSTGPIAGETREEWIARKERVRQATPLMKVEYGASGGMYTEVDPAEIDMSSWSGTAMKGQKLQSDEAGDIEQDFFFTPYLGEYAVITIENTGTKEATVVFTRPYTVGSQKVDTFAGVRIPAGQKLTQAFRIDYDRPLENQLRLNAHNYLDEAAELTVTAEQYRFGK